MQSLLPAFYKKRRKDIALPPRQPNVRLFNHRVDRRHESFDARLDNIVVDTHSPMLAALCVFYAHVSDCLRLRRLGKSVLLILDDMVVLGYDFFDGVADSVESAVALRFDDFSLSAVLYGEQQSV